MMFRAGIKTKMFLTLLAASCAVVIGMHLLMQWSFNRGFLRYLHELEMQRLEQLVPLFEKSYVDSGDWRELLADRRELRRLLHQAFPPRAEDDPPPPPLGFDDEVREHRHNRAVARLERRLVLLDALRHPLLGPAPPPPQLEMLPLHRGEEIIGYLGLLPRERPEDRHQIDFLQRQKRAFTLISFIMAAVAALFALPLAHHLVKRIRNLAGGTRTLADGDFSVRLPVDSHDELGQLARDFNHLALTLEKNERQRRQWVADISHELRTPLAVLRGEIEALQDGIRPATPESLHSLHGEVQRLTRLVEDLYQLALSDVGALDYHLSTFDINTLLADVTEGLSHLARQQGLSLSVTTDARPCPVHADPERIRQLLDNLLGNALKYTASPGEIVVRSAREDGTLVLDIYDTPPGVSEQQLPRLFERLYRVEKSRSRSGGGAGLGLAICQNIVAGHDGSIDLRPSPLGGLWIQVRLPLQEVSA